MIRVFVGVSDPARRAALLRTLRDEPSVRVVSSEDEADVVCRDAQSETISLPATTMEGLTPRELEVLRLVANGLDNLSIAAELGIARATVKHHLEAIYAKLGVHGRTGAVREGIRRGVVAV